MPNAAERRPSGANQGGGKHLKMGGGGGCEGRALLYHAHDEEADDEDDEAQLDEGLALPVLRLLAELLHAAARLQPRPGRGEKRVGGGVRVGGGEGLDRPYFFLPTSGHVKGVRAGYGGGNPPVRSRPARLAGWTDVFNQRRGETALFSHRVFQCREAH